MKLQCLAISVLMIVFFVESSQAQNLVALEKHEAAFGSLIWEGDRWEDLVGSESAQSLSEAEIYLNWKKPYPKPPDLSAADIRSVERALKSSNLALDSECRLSRAEIEFSEIALSKIDQSVCRPASGLRHQQIVWLAATQGLYACENGQVVMAIRSSIGSNGLHKKEEGDRKTPVGEYWLGLPRVSEKFGIFIPVGYPNASDVADGRTGSAVGIHGPLRYGIFASPCAVENSLSRNWTAGCIAAGRDTQVMNLSRWMIKNWPIQLIVLP
jgi:hypothetical protein